MLSRTLAPVLAPLRLRGKLLAPLAAPATALCVLTSWLAADAWRAARTAQGTAVALAGFGIAAFGIALAMAVARDLSCALGGVADAARRVAARDLRVKIDIADGGELGHVGEVGELASAFEAMTAELRRMVGESNVTAAQLTEVASSLSETSEAVAGASSEVADAIATLAGGAERQLQGARSADAALREMAGRSADIDAASEQAMRLGAEIGSAAVTTRARVTDALRVLVEVRELVGRCAQRVAALEARSAQIEGLADAISRVAEQSDLLALNAAIEAARAGAHGRGFGIVAEEMRTLSEESGRAAADVTRTIEEVRDAVRSVVGVMEAGVSKVNGVSEVSEDAAAALEDILGAVDGVRVATTAVADALGRNRSAMEGARKGAAEVSDTAAAHAAMAEGASAAAQETSAATQEMSAWTSDIRRSAERLRAVVSGFQL